MHPDIIKKYNRPAPRYTSYPPANYFGAFDGKDYLEAVEASDHAPQTPLPLLRMQFLSGREA